MSRNKLIATRACRHQRHNYETANAVRTDGVVNDISVFEAMGEWIRERYPRRCIMQHSDNIGGLSRTNVRREDLSTLFQGKHDRLYSPFVPRRCIHGMPGSIYVLPLSFRSDPTRRLSRRCNAGTIKRRAMAVGVFGERKKGG